MLSLPCSQNRCCFVLSIAGCFFKTDSRAHDIQRSCLDFLKNTAEIFADDAKGKEYESAKAQGDDHKRCVSWHINAPNQGAQDKPDSVAKADEGHTAAKVAPDTQGQAGKAGDAIQGEVPQLPAIPLACSSCTRGTLVVYQGLFEAYPGVHALGKADAFRKRVESIDALSVQKTEIPCIIH